MRKKLFTLLLVLVASTTALLAQVTIDGMTYSLYNGEAMVYSFDPATYYAIHKDSVVIIPEYVEYGGKKYNVTNIRVSNLMNGNTGSYTTEYAFNSCAIKKMIWQAKHCKNSFGYWKSSSASGWYTWSGYNFPFVSVSIKNLVIDDNVENIPNYLFANATIDTLCLGAKVKNVGAWSFCSDRKSQSYQTTLVLPDSVQSIGEGAFHNIQFDTLIVGKSVKSISASAFTSSSISHIEWNAIRCYDFSSDNTIFYNSKATSYDRMNISSYDYCSNIKSIVFGNEVEYIPAYLCSRMNNVKEIEIPCSVVSIGKQAMPSITTCNITRQCDITFHTEYSMSLCEGEQLKWNNINISNIKPSDSGDYTFETKTALYDDSIVTLHLSVIPTSYTTLRDTILCYEDDLTLDGIKCTLHKSITKKQLWSYTLKSIDGCDSVINISVLWKKPEMQLPDTILCYNDDLVLDGIKCPLTKKANIKQLWSYTLQTADGCDSTISINVTWQKLSNFTITTRHEFDTYNSGSISYKKDDANYIGNYYYTLNGEKGRSLYNLSKGNYRLVFYSEECGDSIVKNITINQYGMKVNGMYYLLDENNHTAKVTYRGTSYDDYNGEYSGNITIPKKITFDGKEYQVTGIDYSAFSGCNNISSITMESETPISMYNSGLSSNSIIYVPFGSLNAYKSASGWSYYKIHVINPSHATTTTAATSAKITLGNTDEAKHISSCGMEGGEEFAGNVIEYIGLEPNSEYANIPLFIKTKEDDMDNTTVSFTTTALELTTKPSKPVSSNTAILLAETNMSDAEISCGFEWKRNDAPADMEGNKVFCPVASGQMAGRLKNLKDDVYYKYRAFYQSAAGKMYYGDWQYIFTGDVTVEFDPVLYTYGATVVHEKDATISGYALAGSEDFTEQGFEYWSESRANGGANVPHRMPTALGEHFFVQASGIALRVTLTNLDAGTVYKYRVYGKVGEQYYYGAEQSFTTQGEYEGDDSEAIDEVPSDQVPSAKALKVLRNGQIFILRGDKVYTTTGQEVK